MHAVCNADMPPGIGPGGPLHCTSDQDLADSPNVPPVPILFICAL